MELNKNFENYHIEAIDKGSEYVKKETYSVNELSEKLIGRIRNSLFRNNLNGSTTPVFIKYKNHLYTIDNIAICYGVKGSRIQIEIDDYGNKLTFIAPDSKPLEGGEYWSSRGIGIGGNGPDCSGFVKSKKAGERLLRLVKYILDTDEPLSYLDYREYEPNWIQFKFCGKEFDVEKLDKLSREAGNILTEEILRECKL